MPTLEEIRRRDKPAERWWKPAADEEPPACEPEPREGFPCPSCLLGELHYNGLFQLLCDACGRIAEAGVFT